MRIRRSYACVLVAIAFAFTAVPVQHLSCEKVDPYGKVGNLATPLPGLEQCLLHDAPTDVFADR